LNIEQTFQCYVSCLVTSNTLVLVMALAIGVLVFLGTFLYLRRPVMLYSAQGLMAGYILSSIVLMRCPMFDVLWWYLGSVLVGIAFGAGWTPCIGPILGSILMYTGTRASLGEGMLLLGAYSLGLAVPFLVAAVAVERFLGWFQRFRRFIPLTTKLSGAVLILVGVLLMTGYFTLLAGWLQGLTPDFLQERL